MIRPTPLLPFPSADAWHAMVAPDARVVDSIPPQAETDPALRDVLLVCDHASNSLPEPTAISAETNALGIAHAHMESHIAYDIGAADVCRHIAAQTGAAAVLGKYSRLWIDLNRIPGSPNAIPSESDGVDIPANANLSAEARWARTCDYHLPYHAAITRAMLAHQLTYGVVPRLVAIHSCTAQLAQATEQRPWKIGVLWHHYPQFAHRLRDHLQRMNLGAIGDNEPYSAITGPNWTCNRHALAFEAESVAIELRQDLFARQDAPQIWGDILVEAMRAAA